MLESQESGFEFEVEMIARAIALGLPIEWVPIRTIYARASPATSNHGGTSANSCG